MKNIGSALGLLLALSAAGAEIIPPDPAALARVAAGKCPEARAAWWGFDPADATAALQAAINSGARKVVVASLGAPWVVDKLQLASDQELVFEPGVVVQAKRGAFHGTGDSLFTAVLKTNVTLTGPGATLRMWKSDYDDKAHYQHAEWRHVLCLKSCTRVTVTGLTLADSGGDGIYLGVARQGVPCSEVVIRDVNCTNNYRQGISVISARDLLIEHCTLADTGGTAPEAGIDFEPNHDSDELANCVMRNCVSVNNRGDAFTFYLRPLRATSRPISIRLENCRSIGCRRGASFVTGNDSAGAGVKGTMEFSRCTFTASRFAGITVADKPATGARVRFDRCAVINAATNDAAQTPLLLASRANAAEDFGNIHFVGCVVQDPLDRPPLSYQDMAGGTGLRDITGTLIVKHGDASTTHELTPQQLAAWIPQSSFKPFPKFNPQDVCFVPVRSGAQPDTKRRSTARQRGPGEWLLWAEAGQPATFTVLIRPVGKNPSKPASVSVVAPSGKVMTFPAVPCGSEGTNRFSAAEPGAYKILCDAHSGTATVNSPTNRVCLFSGRSAFHFLSTIGEYFFWVPAGTREFAVKVSGDNAGEPVKAALRDPNGKTVAEQDNIVQAQQFVAAPLDAVHGEVWSLRLDRPAHGVLEDFHVQLQGVPPVFAHTPAALLKPVQTTP